MPKPDERWHDFLDRIEADVASAAASLDDPSAPVHTSLWVPPDDLGPMPAELAERALTVLAAQQIIRERLQGSREDVSRQMGALRAVPETRNGKSIYLDVIG